MRVLRVRTILSVATLTIVLTALLPAPLTATAQVHINGNCDMAAMMARAGHKVSWFSNQPGAFDDPNDFFSFLIQRSTSSVDPDGYGIIYAGDDGLFPNPTITTNQAELYFDHAWYVKALNTGANTYHYSNYPGPMNAAQATITNMNVDVAIVLGHDRNASSLAIGSHPFRFEYNGTVYTFMHNGGIESGIKSALYTALGGVTWFNQHPPNWTTSYGDVANLIDSEVLFHWIMSKVIAHNGDVFKGVLEALTATVGGYDLEDEFRQDYANNIINFVLSDGEALYLFRNSADTGPKLSWAEPQTGLFMVKTQDELAHPLNQFDFVSIPRYGEPNALVSFFDYDLAGFVSSEVNNATCNDTTCITDEGRLYDPTNAEDQALLLDQIEITKAGTETCQDSLGETLPYVEGVATQPSVLVTGYTLPDLSVGRTATLRVEISNPTPDTAEDVTISFDPGQNALTVSKETLSLGSLAGGGSTTLEIQFVPNGEEGFLSLSTSASNGSGKFRTIPFVAVGSFGGGGLGIAIILLLLLVGVVSVVVIGRRR